MNTIQTPPFSISYEYTIRRGPDQGKVLRFHVHKNEEIRGDWKKHVKIVEADKFLSTDRYRTVQIFARHKGSLLSIRADNGKRVGGKELCCAVFFPHPQNPSRVVPFFTFESPLFNTIFTDPQSVSGDSTDPEDEEALHQACEESLRQLRRDAQRRN